MVERKLKGVCFGEILFDVFLKNKKIGGAPLNVASRIKSLRGDISIIRAVGNDEDGRELITYSSSLGINASTIQVKDEYPTGLVNVILDEKGNASYDIQYPSAWDKIEVSKEYIALVNEADFFVFGSLASRDDVSRNTLKQLLEVAKYKIFDINLRAPHYAMETLLDFMNAADFIKFNDDELYEIAINLKSPFKSLEQNIKFISEATKTDRVCVTLGSHGAVLYTNQQFYYNCGYKVKVMDAVGSGDSFLATLITTLFTENNPQKAINCACAIGAIVAQNEGANPVIKQEELDEFLKGF
jgi:fructokinase